LVFHDGLYHSFSHHGSFSHPTENECLHIINGQLQASANNLQHAEILFVTLGTAYAYRLKATGEVVANCHKLPETLFERQRLSVQQIVDEWKDLLQILWNSYPTVNLVFTVSPIRQWKDGAHDNQLSKSILLIAIDTLQQLYPDKIGYFPAYELIMDELRDYRFYADDMIHPSTKAIQFVQERFCETFMDAQTLALLKEIDNIRNALNHKSLHPNSASYTTFLQQTLAQVHQLNKNFPYLCFSTEIEILQNRLKNVT
jgi:hypothetical protein